MAKFISSKRIDKDKYLHIRIPAERLQALKQIAKNKENKRPYAHIVRELIDRYIKANRQHAVDLAEQTKMDLIPKNTKEENTGAAELTG